METSPSKQKSKFNFYTDVFRLVSGNIVATAIILAFTPIIARVYPTEAYGMAALFTSVVTIIGAIACFRYEMSIVLPESDQSAANLLIVSLGFTFLVSLITGFVIFLVKEQLSIWFKIPIFADYLLLIPLAVFFHGSYKALNHWSIRTNRFSTIAFSRVIDQFSTTMTILGFGLIGYNTGSTMIFAGILGKVIANLILGGAIVNSWGSFIIRKVKLLDMICELKIYKKFPIFGVWSVLLSISAWQLPVLLLGVFFSPSIVGYYALGFKILQMPMKFVGDAISKVFFQRASVEYNEGRLGILVDDLFHQLTMVGLIPILTLSIIGRDLYIVFFGEKWAEAGLYSQILSLWAFFWFLSGPFTKIFAIVEKQETQLLWNIFNFSLRLASIVIGGYYKDARLAISLLAVSGTIVYSYKVYLTLRLANASIVKAFLVTGKRFLIFLPIGLLLGLLTYYQVNRLLILAVAFVFIAFYFIWILRNILAYRKRYNL